MGFGGTPEIGRPDLRYTSREVGLRRQVDEDGNLFQPPAPPDSPGASPFLPSLLKNPLTFPTIAAGPRLYQI